MLQLNVFVRVICVFARSFTFFHQSWAIPHQYFTNNVRAVKSNFDVCRVVKRQVSKGGQYTADKHRYFFLVALCLDSDQHAQHHVDDS